MPDCRIASLLDCKNESGLDVSAVVLSSTACAVFSTDIVEPVNVREGNT